MVDLSVSSVMVGPDDLKGSLQKKRLYDSI